MICACARALRSMTLEPSRELRAGAVHAAQHLRPAEDRIQRRAQLVAERREELVLHAARALGFAARGALGLQAAARARLSMRRLSVMSFMSFE